MNVYTMYQKTDHVIMNMIVTWMHVIKIKHI